MHVLVARMGKEDVLIPFPFHGVVKTSAVSGVPLPSQYQSSPTPCMYIAESQVIVEALSPTNLQGQRTIPVNFSKQ